MNIIRKIALATSSNTAIVEKIHNEFDSASEKPLKEATEILSKDFSSDKANKLSSLGFRSAKPVKEYNEKFSWYDESRFSICAPKKDFDLSNSRVTVKGNKIVSIPDPIVLQPVKGGYLIVTKWGLEAEDKDLVNEKMN